MSVEIHQFTNEAEWLRLRLLDITSTEIGALFGLSPYMTKYELWHRKKAAEVVAFEQNTRMKWGTRLQDAIAYGIAEDHGFKIRPMKEYIRDGVLRIGASFDFAIQEYPENSVGVKGIDVGLLEIKNVDGLIFSQQWEVDDDDHIEAPPHIELQVQQQLMISGLGFAKIGALVGGNEVALVHRLPDLTVHSRIKEEVKDFWDSIEKNEPPEIDFQRDADFLVQLYAHAEPGKIINATDEIASLAMQYSGAQGQEKLIAEEKKALKAQILTLIGDAEKVKGENFSISAGVRGPTIIETYERAGYRDFRVNVKKPKGE